LAANAPQSAQIVLHIEREMALHLDYCESFGLTKQEMEDTKEDIGKVFLLTKYNATFAHRMDSMYGL